ncbi:MAG: hypothetical protein LQ338_007218 [Usnochroma carphineum]|nr:MAG: hypothetical protein LQ338_007218 [Usnochroma carphineum]
MRLLRLLRERREVARDTKEKVDNYNQKLQEVQALEKKLAEVEEEQRIDAAQDPRLARLHNLKRVLKEGQIINQFTGLNPIGEPDAHKAAMEEQGIPEHIREQVISQREANIEEARRRLEELWKDDPEPPRNPLP